jgi:4-nitrophenyl phosphatase
MPLADIKAVISDMDGVLWRGTRLLPGMHDLFSEMRARDLPFVLATNNSGRHPEAYVQRLADKGVAGIDAAQIITSGTATADTLRAQYPDGARLHVIGEAGLRRVLSEAGFVLVDSGGDVDAVVCGIDFDFTYAKARHATLLIRNHGAAFIGTNPDVTFPSPAGLVPGAGSVIGMIEIATDVTPQIIGKPQPAMFRVALERLGTSAHETLMIGDRLNTDIEGAQALGMQTAMVLTGVNTRAEIAQSTIKPDYIFEDLPDLLANW